MGLSKKTWIWLTGLAFCGFIYTGVAVAAETYTITGKGYGHGVGMSQWGAYGYAKQGFNYRDILGHYYSGATVSSEASDKVRVLLKTASRLKVSGIAKVSSGEALDPNATYKLSLKDGKVRLRGGGKDLSFEHSLRLRPASAFTLAGRALNGVNSGSYRGSLFVLPAGRNLEAIDVVGLENYVRSVVPKESPSSWPQDALQAQAVAARSYALATKKTSGDFDLYPDTRSQVYGGVRAETPATDLATSSTAGQVMKSGGKVATTYFFSTSGGRTENIEQAWPGSKPASYLVGVDDPYETASPYETWGPITFTRSELQRKLGPSVKGELEDVTVNDRGTSGRVIKVTIKGAEGETTITGPKLQRLLGMRSSWFYIDHSGEADNPTQPGGTGAVKGQN